jgi:hypothetical protein
MVSTTWGTLGSYKDSKHVLWEILTRFVGTMMQAMGDKNLKCGRHKGRNIDFDKR